MEHPPPELAERLRAYAALVRRWSAHVGLVAADDLERFEDRHIADSLRALRWLRAAPRGPCVDVGSGAGLPGIPLALADPARLWVFLEPRARRAAFLEEAVRELGLAARVVALRAEEAARRADFAGAHAFATARALAPPRMAFELLLPLLAPRGVALVFVGEGNHDLPPETQVPEPGIATIVRGSPDAQEEAGK